MNKEIELLDVSRLLKMYWEHILKIVFWIFLGGVAFFLYSFLFVTPQYKSSAEILVNQKSFDDQNQSSQQDAAFKAIGTYKDVLTKSVILYPTAKILQKNDNYHGGTKGLKNAISIGSKEDSQVITIKAKYKNPYIAADMANTVADVFSTKIPKMVKVDNVTVVSHAKESRYPVSPNKKKYVLFGMFAGFVMSVIGYTIQFLADTRVKTEDFFTEDIGAISLGQVSHITNKNSSRGLVYAKENQPVFNRKKRV